MKNNPPNRDGMIFTCDHGKIHNLIRNLFFSGKDYLNEISSKYPAPAERDKSPHIINLSLLNYVSFVPTCPHFLRAYVPIYFFRTSLLSFLKLFCAYVRSFFTYLCAYNHSEPRNRDMCSRCEA